MDGHALCSARYIINDLRSYFMMKTAVMLAALYAHTVADLELSTCRSTQGPRGLSGILNS